MANLIAIRAVSYSTTTIALDVLLDQYYKEHLIHMYNSDRGELNVYRTCDVQRNCVRMLSCSITNFTAQQLDILQQANYYSDRAAILSILNTIDVKQWRALDLPTIHIKDIV